MTRGTRGHIKHEGVEESIDLVDAKMVRSRRRSSTPRSLQKVTVTNNKYRRRKADEEYDEGEYEDLAYRRQKMNKGKKPKTKRCKRKARK